jgi:hypothetical protein
MNITNSNIYNLAEAILASGFPMLSKDPTDDWNKFEFHIIDEILRIFNFKKLNSGEHKIVYQCLNTQK